MSAENKTNDLSKTLCGSDLPDWMWLDMSKEGLLKLEFSTDTSVSKPGFFLKYNHYPTSTQGMAYL